MNARPLFVTDCDEVLLHMVRHFSSWLDEEQDVLFRPEDGDMGTALRFKETGDVVPKDQIWSYLGVLVQVSCD